MECLSIRQNITSTVDQVRDASYKEKKSLFSTQEQIDTFLDKILEFKGLLTEKTEEVESFCEKLETFTWFEALDEECLKLLNDVIAATRDWRSSLVRQYISMDILKRKKIATAEIKNFKYAIDDLREVCDDLESVFFYLPKNDSFTETTKELSLL